MSRHTSHVLAGVMLAILLVASGGAAAQTKAQKAFLSIMEITADLIRAMNETSWVDGIGTIVVLLIGYAAYRWIKKKTK